MTVDARVWTVTSTTPTRDAAAAIARTVVAERLAAGAEVTGPALSVFWHLSELREGKEWRVSLHCPRSGIETLMMRVVELHPWNSPEVTAFPVPVCLDSYADWVERTTGSVEETRDA